MEERLVRVARSYAKSIALENRQRPEAFVKLVDTVDGRQDGIDRGLASPDGRLSERQNVRLVTAQPGHESGELTQPDVGPSELCPVQVVPEQLEGGGRTPAACSASVPHRRHTRGIAGQAPRAGGHLRGPATT